MPKIFISYRRDDNPAAAARVREGLAAKFGKSNLFMDVDNLLAGLRFDEELAKALGACDVFIAIIGERWLDLMRAKAEARQPDYVRAEIAAALQRKIAVIPVRVGREGQLPRLPEPGELPPEIRDLVHFQKHDVTHENHGRDVASLIEAIGAVRRHLQPERQGMRWGWVGSGVVAALTLGYVGAAQLGAPVPWDGLGPTQAQIEAKRIAAQAAGEIAVAAKKDEEERRQAEAKAIANRERADYAIATATNTVAGWTSYLNSWPNGANATTAVGRLQDLAAKDRSQNNRYEFPGLRGLIV